MSTEILAGCGKGWAVPLFESVTQQKLLEKCTGGIFAPWCFDPCMLYCFRRCGWDLFLAQSYQGLVIISLPSTKEELA